MKEKTDGNMIIPPNWLTRSLVGWVSETDNMEGKSYLVHVIKMEAKMKILFMKKHWRMVEDTRWVYPFVMVICAFY